MTRRLGMVVGALTLSLLFNATANAAMQLHSPSILAADERMTLVTFWAQPYPDRYVPRRRCPRVRVETPYGWYWDRVCVAHEGAVLRRAY